MSPVCCLILSSAYYHFVCHSFCLQSELSFSQIWWSTSSRVSPWFCSLSYRGCVLSSRLLQDMICTEQCKGYHVTLLLAFPLGSVTSEYGIYIILCLSPQNILEMTVCDKDTFTSDDQLLTVCFDVAKIQPGEKVCLNFELNPEVRNANMGETKIK